MAKKVFHPTIVLIGPTDNPNGRQLIQVHNTIIILSECCGSRINEGGPYNRCSNCDKELCENQGWATSIASIDHWTRMKIPSSIPIWLEFWFGMPDMGMRIT